MSRRTRTAWLVVGHDGTLFDACTSLRRAQRRWPGRIFRKIPVRYPWPPAKKRRSKC